MGGGLPQQGNRAKGRPESNCRARWPYRQGPGHRGQKASRRIRGHQSRHGWVAESHSQGCARPRPCAELGKSSWVTKKPPFTGLVRSGHQRSKVCADQGRQGQATIRSLLPSGQMQDSRSPSGHPQTQGAHGTTIPLLLSWVRLKGLIRGLGVLLLVIFIFTQEISRKEENLQQRSGAGDRGSETSCLTPCGSPYYMFYFSEGLKSPVL